MAASVSVYPRLALITAALLAAAILAGAAVLLLRGDDNAAIQVVIPTSEQRSDASTGLANPAAPEAVEQLKVYVTGAVRRPGVYQLEHGDRLVDAVESAGGAEEGAQLDLVNLSLRVVDQGHYRIPRLGEVPGDVVTIPEPPIQGASGAGLAGLDRPDGRLDLNSAPAELLETLPGIGPVLAKAIVDYRESSGGFQSVEEITNVARIGPVTYEKIRDLVTVGPSR